MHSTVHISTSHWSNIDYVEPHDSEYHILRLLCIFFFRRAYGVYDSDKVAHPLAVMGRSSMRLPIDFV